MNLAHTGLRSPAERPRRPRATCSGGAAWDISLGTERNAAARWVMGTEPVRCAGWKPTGRDLDHEIGETRAQVQLKFLHGAH